MKKDNCSSAVYWAGVAFCGGAVFRRLLAPLEGAPWYVWVAGFLLIAIVSCTSWLGAGILLAMQ